VDSSVYCLPADILGEGAGTVLGNIRELAGVPGVTVAACYHSSSDVYPHNPAYRVSSLAPGAFYQVDPSGYAGLLRPAVSHSAAGRDILAETCLAGGRLGMKVAAWAVLLHRDDLDGRRGELQENCFGDLFPGRLCPANPAVRDYALAMTRELCSYPISALRAEALHYQGAVHGAHHERCLEDYGELARFVLGLCFCPCCAEQGTRSGVDVPGLARRCRRYLTDVFGSAEPPRTWDARSLTEVCGPDMRGYLTARTAAVTSLARAVADESRRAGVRLTVLDETIPMQSYSTGYGFDPAHEAVPAELGIDPRAMAQAGVPLEEPVYLAESSDACSAIDWYLGQIGSAAGLSVLLRPGPPDTRSADSLRDKVAAAAARGCAEVNFYVYGLYRLRALDLIRTALAPG
jgi:hypothetical protein